ncbi:MAG: undecaprenyl-phosphate glucose phosphotransferase [gamma proteobacterium symbiont of Taylorina sp.]|nr:undecaprenyl-phosphate glucose phosphotransferase [gamma proteobacterium symbiont of Taylorina sp.]
MQNISLKKEYSSFSLLYRLFDLVVLVSTSLLAYFLYFDSLDLPLWYRIGIAIAVALATFIFSIFSLHKTWRGSLLRQEFRQVILAWISIFLILSLLVFITKTNNYFSRGWFTIWFISGVTLDLMLRGVIRKYLSYIRKEGKNHRPIIIVSGDGNMGFNICNILQQQKWTGLKVVGYFSDYKKPTDKDIFSADLTALVNFLKDNTVYQVWIAMPLSAENEVKNILHSLRFYSGDIKYIPDFYGFNLINHSFSEIAGIPIINMSESPFSDGTHFLKRFQDLSLSCFILIMISPLIIIISLAIKLTSIGSVFYKQERISWNNKKFMMLKFRTMPMGIEKESGAVWAKKNDDRTTKLGRFLRSSSLDELPQFLNVLMGDMSIVGPRPERPVFVEQFKHEIPQYMKKHMVKAGITGWAQVNGLRGNTDLQKRIEYDIYYIEHWSLLFDVKIIILTLFKGFINKNAY